MIGTLLSMDVTMRIATNHDRQVILTDSGDLPLYIVCEDGEMIANLLLRLNCSAYIYNDIRIGYREYDYLHITVPVLEAWQKRYAGKRGRKPAIALYVIDADGKILEAIRP